MLNRLVSLLCVCALKASEKRQMAKLYAITHSETSTEKEKEEATEAMRKINANRTGGETEEAERQRGFPGGQMFFGNGQQFFKGDFGNFFFEFSDGNGGQSQKKSRPGTANLDETVLRVRTKSDFDFVVNQPSFVKGFFMIYSPTCPHCQRMYEPLNQVSRQTSGKIIVCESSSPFCQGVNPVTGENFRGVPNLTVIKTYSATGGRGFKPSENFPELQWTDGGSLRSASGIQNILAQIGRTPKVETISDIVKKIARDQSQIHILLMTKRTINEEIDGLLNAVQTRGKGLNKNLIFSVMSLKNLMSKDANKTFREDLVAYLADGDKRAACAVVAVTGTNHPQYPLFFDALRIDCDEFNKPRSSVFITNMNVLLEGRGYNNQLVFNTHTEAMEYLMAQKNGNFMLRHLPNGITRDDIDVETDLESILGSSLPMMINILSVSDNTEYPEVVPNRLYFFKVKNGKLRYQDLCLPDSSDNYLTCSLNHQDRHTIPYVISDRVL